MLKAQLQLCSKRSSKHLFARNKSLLGEKAVLRIRETMFFFLYRTKKDNLFEDVVFCRIFVAD